jgi:SAM-dependent methyltransferase
VTDNVDLYEGAYGNYDARTYREVRLETYGEDLGQTSWVTREESQEIPQLLELNGNSSVLEVGCGSGGYALHVAKRVRCDLVGVDINAAGIRKANQLGVAGDLAQRVHFQQCDVSKSLPFDDNTFDAVFSNDVLCHIPGRPALLNEMLRVLKSGGRMLFSDALVVGGMVSHEEIATRSAIGYYVYSPPGENERLIERTGFHQVRVTDTTEGAAQIAERWLHARQKRKSELLAMESISNFEGLQRFLSTAHSLMAERRLLRYLYLAYKS